LSRLRDRDGNAIGTIGISKDITTEKKLKDLLAQAQTAASIGQAATAIQHAIKNMLNTLTGGSYLVRHGTAKKDQERIEEGIAMIDEGISTIGGLSLNLLKYAKKWTLEVEAIELTLLIEDVCKAVKQTARDEGVRIRRNIPGQLPLVSCDSQLLRMALMDLATNALDACFLKCYKDTETPEVLFSAYLEKGGNLVVVEVEDNGAGMDEATKANVFAPFFTTKGESGTGLGLALTSRIVKLHGGEIEVESELGEGSRFRMTLPVTGVNTNEGAEDGQEGLDRR
jgi:signal transduction histidine kinase